MNQEELEETKKLLIERLGVHIECKDQLAPLAARILATLVLTGKKGATFEDLVTGLQASKSTISTHLNTLQSNKNITYYTICGDRKKYFITNPDGFIINLDKMITTWEKEMADDADDDDDFSRLPLLLVLPTVKFFVLIKVFCLSSPKIASATFSFL